MSAQHSSHEPHNTVSAKAYEAARVLEGEGYQIVVMLTREQEDGRTENGIAIVGYETDASDGDEGRIDVTRKALADVLAHADAMAESMGLQLQVVSQGLN